MQRARVELRDNHHGAVERIDATRDEVLQVGHHLRADRDRVHVGSHREHGTGAAGDQSRDDTRRNRFVDTEPTDRAERRFDEPRDLLFIEGELGIRVEVPAPRDDLCNRVGGGGGS